MMEGRERGFQCARQQVVFPDCVRKASAPGFARSQHLVSPRCLDKLQLHESAGERCIPGANGVDGPDEAVVRHRERLHCARIACIEPVIAMRAMPSRRRSRKRTANSLRPMLGIRDSNRTQHGRDRRVDAGPGPGLRRPIDSDDVRDANAAADDSVNRRSAHHGSFVKTSSVREASTTSRSKPAASQARLYSSVRYAHIMLFTLPLSSHSWRITFVGWHTLCRIIWRSDSRNTTSLGHSNHKGSTREFQSATAADHVGSRGRLCFDHAACPWLNGWRGLFVAGKDGECNFSGSWRCQDGFPPPARRAQVHIRGSQHPRRQLSRRRRRSLAARTVGGV